MADRFFAPGPLVPGEFILEGPEAHHLATVRRIAPGDRVVLFCGDGFDYPAEVVATDRKRVLLNVLPPVAVNRELGFRLEIAAALPKGDRGDFLVEKLTELGVTRLIPLQTQRTVVLPKESRLEKLRHAVIEASKQCGRNVLMQIDPLTPWEVLVNSPIQPKVRVILHPSLGKTDALSLGDLSRDAIHSGGVQFAIGPEGGFTTEEVEWCHVTGWAALSLGPRILRVETAASAVAAWAGAVATSSK
jgi:16S rRNA (uracil1498-N3)-methyltransferase